MNPLLTHSGAVPPARRIRMSTGVIKYPVPFLFLLLLTAVAPVCNSGTGPAKDNSSNTPATGIMTQSYSAGVSPFRIKTTKGEDYFIKLDDAVSGDTIFTAYIRGGDSLQLMVPACTGVFKYATGAVWHGADSLFGQDTRYMKAEEKLPFDDGSGWTIELVPQVGGNLDHRRILAEEF